MKPGQPSEVLGLLLDQSEQDTANLCVLLELYPKLADVPWTRVPHPKGALLCPELNGLEPSKVQDTLARAGLPVMRISAPRSDPAPNLVQALGLTPWPGDPLVSEALFWMDMRSDAPRLILERLLLLGRDDVAIVEWQAQDSQKFCVQVSQPPLYLMMLANDRSQEGVVVFYRPEKTRSLWLEWGYSHPLPKVADRGLQGAGVVALVDRDGRWMIAPERWSQRSIYDAMQPTLQAPKLDLHPFEGKERFVVPLRLAPGEVQDPDLWLLDAQAFFELEPLVESATAEELRRLTVARLQTAPTPDGAFEVRYLLKERAQGKNARLGPRVSSLLNVAGYSKVAGVENLYVPVGRRLVPQVRRDELRKMLALDDAKLVIIHEDEDGPQQISIRELVEGSLFQWVEYVATDRRLALDRSMERSVFDMPMMKVERPPQPKLAAPPPPRRRPERPMLQSRPEPIKPMIKEEELQPAPDQELLSLQEQARPLEVQISAGGATEPQTWRELGMLKARLNDVDESGACLESALFYAPAQLRGELCRALVAQRTLQLGAELPQNILTELLLKDSHTPAEAAFLGARLTERVLAGAPPSDELVQVALHTFIKGKLPISRRLSWCFLRAWHNHANDTLGLTRAKEAVLGQLNVEGLSQMYDLPRFVRLALALEDDAQGLKLQENRGEMLDALESLWSPVDETLEEFDAHANFTRLIFSVGFMRLGASARARDIVQPVEHELPAHDTPNQLLFRLYLSRMAYEATEGDEAAWLKEADAILQGADSKQRRPADWLRARSLWLAPPKMERSAELSSKLLRFIEPHEQEPQELPNMLSQLKKKWTKLYDYEVAAVIERALAAAMSVGNEGLIEDVLDAALPLLFGIKILGHRVQTVGACIKAAQTIEQEARVEQLLDEVVQIAHQDDVPWVRELLVAVQPGLSALRRHGAHETASRLLQALEPIGVRTLQEGIMLKAALSGGFLQVKELKKASQLVDEALEQLFTPHLDYVGRYEGGALTLDVLRHWPTAFRLERYLRVVDGLDHFRDAFTTGQFFKAHKILILERVVDALADSQTRQSDRVQSFLDAEEFAVRRKIISDWNQLCGQ